MLASWFSTPTFTVENNSTYNMASSGISVWSSHNVVVDGNRVEEAGSSDWQECISVGPYFTGNVTLSTASPPPDLDWRLVPTLVSPPGHAYRHR